MSYMLLGRLNFHSGAAGVGVEVEEQKTPAGGRREKPSLDSVNRKTFNQIDIANVMVLCASTRDNEFSVVA